LISRRRGPIEGARKREPQRQAPHGPEACRVDKHGNLIPPAAPNLLHYGVGG
jgi:hypothetical protein